MEPLSIYFTGDPTIVEPIIIVFDKLKFGKQENDRNFAHTEFHTHTHKHIEEKDQTEAEAKSTVGRIR